MISSCDKDKTCKFSESGKTAPEGEVTSLRDSLEKYGIRDAMQHPSGFFYKIEDKGSGNYVTNLCATVSAEYWGGFFNGRGFDSSIDKSVKFVLGQTIIGWQKGIPLINAGGRMTLYIPPSLAYGNDERTGPNGVVIIPRNSYLVFRVHVTKID